jgi:hypothetical protein
MTFWRDFTPACVGKQIVDAKAQVHSSPSGGAGARETRRGWSSFP